MSKTIIKNLNGLPVVNLETENSSLMVSLCGGTVLSWKVSGLGELIWISPYSSFEVGKPIRGGSPVCFPWFGPNRVYPERPFHGFVRTQIWDIKEYTINEDSSVSLVLSLDTASLKDTYEYEPMDVELEYTLSDNLSMKMKIKNKGSKAQVIENGFHTYFAADPASASFSSLKGLYYYDRMKDFSKELRTDDFRFDSKTESAHFYMDAPEENTFYSKNYDIELEHKGFKSLILWNPGVNAESNPEIKTTWNEFVCVESGNCIDNSFTLNPNESKTSEVIYRLKAHPQTN